MDFSARVRRFGAGSNGGTGNGIPIPIGFTPAPVGRINAVPGAVVTQTTGPDPRQMTIPPGQLTAPGTPVLLGGGFGMGWAFFQVQTAIGLSFPGPGLGGGVQGGRPNGGGDGDVLRGPGGDPDGQPGVRRPGISG